MRGVNRPVPKGYRGHAGDSAPTEGVRALNTLERSLIQTFPPTFEWMGSKTDREQMIGNAVPVKLAEFVAAALREYIKDNCPGNAFFRPDPIRPVAGTDGRVQI
ncbi:MAG: DNA cytosine methyltransferase [Candidatus Methanoplasma sp.]|jgi:DNA (cytosine-5)-methyltransferase 1|nr:DNA cytosine methyltransferase [Candidatus Methanoplasma sp.]